MRAVIVLLLVAGIAYGGYQLFGTTGDDGGNTPPEKEATLAGRPLSEFYLEHDRFLPATDPRTIPAADAAWLRDDDEVFGVVIAGKARAYPVPMISYHHVVNDVIEGIPVAITY